MLKYKVDSISEAKQEGDPHAIYVQLYDDEKPDVKLTEFCVNYETDEQFASELLRKTQKHLESFATQSVLREKVEALLPTAEASIDATKAEIKSQKAISIGVAKESPVGGGGPIDIPKEVEP